ncbi:MAG TPA: phosphoribosylanthranilate isomerase [Acetobacteraceae bacterium]|jgi:phosphoribosylanthranilate isomerase|nr:phosphoribosylanthranilate isomerase [Acetobacteraceae bacterium]
MPRQISNGRVKVCGVNSEAAFDAAVSAGADWIGFVFFPPSPRFVTPARAAELSARKLGGPLRAGLFVDPDAAMIEAALAVLPLDVLQLYAAPERAAALGRHFGRPIWRPVGVASRSDLPRDAAGADALLIEPKAPPEATRPGGNAMRFDWSLLADWRAPGPWVLAGGLNPENVGAAIAASGATAVDVSSGVERVPGAKDPALIRAFIAAARAAWRAQDDEAAARQRPEAVRGG